MGTLWHYDLLFTAHFDNSIRKKPKTVENLIYINLYNIDTYVRKLGVHEWDWVHERLFMSEGAARGIILVIR